MRRLRLNSQPAALQTRNVRRRINMEMMEMVSKVVTALKGDKDMLSAFPVDPVKIVTSILGGNVAMDMIAKIIPEVTKQLGSLLSPDAVKGIMGIVGGLGGATEAVDAAADKVKDAAQDAGGGILGKLKSLF